MICFPNAKINLGLNILHKRDDGFHEIQSAMYPINVCDALEFIPNNETTINQTGMALDNIPTDNIVMKAYELLRKDYPKIGSLRIHLHKNIPSGAGLGGGSADASFMLKTLNDFYELGCDTRTLEQYAEVLGSDCAFFIKNKTALASGRGEILEPISMDLSPYSIQLICPEIHVSTQQAYSQVSPKPNALSLEASLSKPINQWRETVFNDFEKSVFPQFPELEKIKNALYDGGAIYASMSGSGSSVYGIFPKNKKANIQLNVGFKEFYI